MKAVITGSNGFIGSTLVQQLSGLGHEVRCLTRPSSVAKSSNPKVRRFAIDFEQPETLASCGALDDADIVFHVAGVTKALTLKAFRAGNVAPTRVLLDTIERINPGLKRFVLVSSQAAAGPASSVDVPMTESMPANPVEDYGRSKFEAERLLEQSYSFPWTIVRPAAVYGPRDVDFLQLFKQLRLGLGIYPGNRDSYVAIVHVDDLVDGILLAATSESSRNQTYFLTHEVAVPWPEIYRAIGAAWGRNIREISVPLGAVSLAGRLGDAYSKLTGRVSVLNSKKIDLARPRYWICSPQKARTDFGFAPKTPLHAGLRDTLAWYKKEQWI